jgi:16S rRNA (guanine966-N2)-methyltransferase
LRISGGEFKGRGLATFPGKAIRPTPEHVREAIFNILGQRLDSVQVLDLFAGTGALGLEALSRGAAQALFVDISLKALNIINKNIKNLGVKERARAIRHDLTRGLTPLTKFLPQIDLVFMDPPYGKDLAPQTLLRLETLPQLIEGSTVVVEHFRDELNDSSFETLTLRSTRSYGQTALSFFEKVKTIGPSQGISNPRTEN